MAFSLRNRVRLRFSLGILESRGRRGVLCFLLSQLHFNSCFLILTVIPAMVPLWIRAEREIQSSPAREGAIPPALPCSTHPASPPLWTLFPRVHSSPTGRCPDLPTGVWWEQQSEDAPDGGNLAASMPHFHCTSVRAGVGWLFCGHQWHQSCWTSLP